MKVKFDKPAVQAERDDGIKVEYAPAKRPFPVFRWYLILLVVASPIIYFIGTIIADKISIRANGFVSLNLVQVRSPQEGRISSINVAAWDTVSAEQPLVSIAPPQHVLEQRAREQSNREIAKDNHLRAQLERHKTQIAQHQEVKRNATHAQATAKARLISLNQSLSLSKELLTHHQQRYSDTLALNNQGAATAAETAQAKQQLGNAKRQYFSDTAAIQKEQSIIINAKAILASAPPPPPDTQTLAETAALNTLKENTTSTADSIVMSPIDGRIVEIVAVESQYLRPGENILVIAPLQDGVITAYLEAKHSKYAKIGQSARIRIAEGEALNSKIVALPKVAKKLPAEFANAFGVRPLTVVVQLKTEEPLPANYQIHGLPVEIRFQPRIVRWLKDIEF